MHSIHERLRFGRQKLPIILQSEAAECGLACLAMVSSWHGQAMDMTTLRRVCNLSLTGMGLKDVMLVARKIGLTCRPLRLELNELVQLRLPCILHWDLNHFVVLQSVKRNRAVIHDPARGIRTLTMDEASRAFTGVALEVMPCYDFEKKDRREKLSLTPFWRNVSGLWGALAQLFSLSLIMQLFTVVSPLYTQIVVDEVIVASDFDLLTVVAVGFSLLLLFNVVISILRELLVIRLGSQLVIQTVANMFKHLLYLPLSFFEKRHLGDILSRFGSLGPVQNLLTRELVEGSLNVLLLVVTLVMMLIYSWKLTLVSIGFVVAYGIVRAVSYPVFRRINEEIIIADAKESSYFMESIRSMQSVKLFGLEEKRLNGWAHKKVDAINLDIKAKKISMGFGVMDTLLSGAENIIVIYLAALLVYEQKFTIGMIYAFLAWKGQFSSQAFRLIDLVIRVRMISLHLERLADIGLQEKEGGFEQPEPRLAIEGSITIDDLCYRYSDTAPLILDHASATIHQGDSVAIVGPSGSGKTTLMKLLLGLIEPESGSIKIDGLELNRMHKSHYRRQIASVMQDDQLLSGSIAENITMFAEHYDYERTEQVARLAFIHDDIKAMPMGYETLIGEMGNTLSGGQKQRILLARALYRQPKILFMDEATSHLDVKLERAVNQAIQTLGVTRLIIAHRPETIASADRVIVLENKKLQEKTDIPSETKDTETV